MLDKAPPPFAVSAGTTQVSRGTVVFSNSNGLSFGMSGSTVTGSYTVPTVTAGSDTLGISNLGNTAGTSGVVSGDQVRVLFAGGNNVTLSQSVNGASATITISGANTVAQTTQTQNVVVPAAGTQTATSGTVVFSNSNGIAFGMSNSSVITASYTVPTVTAGSDTLGISNLGNTAGTSGVVSGDQVRVVFAGGNNVTLSQSVNGVSATITVSAFNQTAQPGTAFTGGMSNLGNTAGTSGVVSGNAQMLVVGGNNVTVSQSINGQSATLTISGANTVAQTVQTVGLYALGNTTQNSSTTLDARTISFNGLGAATVGYSNGSVQISVPVQTAESNTLGISNLGNTSGTSGVVSAAQVRVLFAGGNNITLSQSVNGASATITISGANAGGAQTGISGIVVSNTTYTSGTVSFSNANGISFGSSAGQAITASYTVPTVTSWTASDSVTSMTIGRLAFTASNGLTLTLSTAAGGSATLIGSYTVPTVTAGSDTAGISNLGNTSGTSGVVSGDQVRMIFAGGNNITLSQSVDAGNKSFTITISGPNTAAQTVQTVGLYALGNTTQNSSTTLDARTISFNGLGGITVGYSNGSVQLSGPQTVAQTVQTVGLYAVGNTTQNSSTTLDARTISFNGLGAVTVGYSNGSVQLSVPVATAGSDTLGISNLGNTSGTSGVVSGDQVRVLFAGGNNITLSQSVNGVSATITISGANVGGAQTGISSVAAAGGTQTVGMLSFANSNGVTFGMSTGANTGTITASVAAQTVQTQNFAAVAAGTQTATSGTAVFSNSNGVTFGMSNSSVVTAAVSQHKASYLAVPESPWQTNFTISNASFSLQHVNVRAFQTVTQADLLMSLSGNSNSSGALTVSLGMYTMAGSTLSLASSDSRQILWTSGSQTTASSLYGGQSGARYRTVSVNNWALTPGDYMLGVWFRTTNDGTWRAYGTEGPTVVGALDAAETQHYLPGFSTSSFTTAMPASVNVTDTNWVRTGGDALKQPGMVALGTF
jgi:hypothetical protein